MQRAFKLNPSLLATWDHCPAIRDADVIFLAVPFDCVPVALASVKDAIKGKIIVDCTNPVICNPENISHEFKSQQSGSEWIQDQWAPDSFVVKAFTIYGFENFDEAVRLQQQSKNPAMPYCGDDIKAKETVAGLIAQLGWQPMDVGGADSALHLEHMALLWIKVVRAQNKPNFVWSIVQ